MVKKKSKPKTKEMPYLGAAVICEKMLAEDKVMSLIRVVDTIGLPMDVPPGTLMELPVTIVIVFKTGKAPGNYRFRMAWITPSDKRSVAVDMNVEFKPPPQGGFNMTSPARLPWEGEGVYWYELMLDEKVYTRIPLSVTVKKNN